MQLLGQSWATGNQQAYSLQAHTRSTYSTGHAPLLPAKSLRQLHDTPPGYKEQCSAAAPAASSVSVISSTPYRTRRRRKQDQPAITDDRICYGDLQVLSLHSATQQQEQDASWDTTHADELSLEYSFSNQGQERHVLLQPQADVYSSAHQAPIEVVAPEMVHHPSITAYQAELHANQRPQEASQPAEHQEHAQHLQSQSRPRRTRTRRLDTTSEASHEAKHLMNKLKACRSITALQALCEQHTQVLNHLHVSCALNRLAKCAGLSQPGNAQAAAVLVDSLEAQFVAHLPKYTAREVANAVWCWGKLDHQPSDNTRQMISHAITARNGHLLSDPIYATPQALANMAWGLANLRWSDIAVWNTLTQAILSGIAQQQPDSFTTRRHHQHSKTAQFAPVDLSVIAWAYATARQLNRPLFEQLIATSVGQIHDFCPQDLSNLLWACATSRMAPPALFHAAAPAVMNCIRGFSAQGLSNTAWAFAVSGVQAGPVMAAICKQAVYNSAALLPSHYNQLFWSMLKTKQGFEPLFKAGLKSALNQPERWKPRNVAQLLYNAASANISDPEIYEQLAPIVVNHLQSFTQGQQAYMGYSNNDRQQHHLLSMFHDCSQLVYAYAHSGLYDAHVYHLVAQLCKTHTSAWLSFSESVQTVVFSLGYAGHYDQALFDIAAEHVTSNADQLPLPHLAGVLVGMAGVQHYDQQACAAAAAHIMQLCRQNNAVCVTSLINAMWALAVLDHFDQQLLHVVFKTLAGRWQRHIDSQQQQQQLNGWHHQSQPAAATRHAHHVERSVNGSMFTSVNGSHPQSHRASEAWIDNKYNSELLAKHSMSSTPVGRGHTTTPSASRELFSRRHLSQIHHICLWLEVCASDRHAAVTKLLPASLREAARHAWMDQAQKQSSVSKTQKEVYSAIRSLGVRADLEQLTDDQLFSIDCLVYKGSSRIALEVNGPQHYTRTEPHRMTGSKVLRDRLVSARGYKVLNLATWEIAEVIEDPRALAQYLKSKLKDV